MEPQRKPTGVATEVGRPARSRGWEIPALDARKGGFSERAALAFTRRGVRPVFVFLLVTLTGLVFSAALSIGLGLLVTHLLDPVAGIGADNERVNVWLAAHRTSARTEASLIGSILGGGVVLPIIVASIAVASAVLRKWRIAAFAVFALGVESATYRITTLAIHSHRPRVVRLEHLPVNASYPSGHTAASLAVFGGVAFLLASRSSSRVFTAVVWVVAATITAFVAVARLYRGMHHPLDVGGGLVVGVAALVVVVAACRTAGGVASLRPGGQQT